MAIIELNITCETSLQCALDAANAAGLNSQGLEEVVECLDMLRVWRKFFRRRFGKLRSLRHRSNPDDPPDIELVFHEKIVAVEHTRLQPRPLGWADDITGKIEPSSCITLPSVSAPLLCRSELLNAMLGVGARPLVAATNLELAVLLECLLATAKRKMQMLSEGGIICVVDRVPLSDFEFEVISDATLRILDSDEFVGCDSYTLFILRRDGPNRTRSTLMRRHEPISFMG